MRSGQLIYADTLAELEKQLGEVSPAAAIAVFSRQKYDVPPRVIFFRTRSVRHPRADLAAVIGAHPGILWHSRSSGPSVTAPAAPAFPPVTTARRLDSRPLWIEAIACTCGGERAAREALTFLETLRHFHPDIPVYLLTDEAGHAILTESEWGATDSDVIDVLSAAEIEALGDSAAGCARPRGDYWPPAWIAAKIECLRRALAAWPYKGVLLADSDLILSRRLPAMEWDADLVLSEHAGPLPDRLPPLSGIYNAGMVLVRAPQIVDRWRVAFETGEGGFYEQGCLEQLAREYVADVFPGAWNWGDWRRTEDLEQSGRIPPVLHVHLCEDGKIPNRAAASRGLRVVARRALTDIRIAKKHPDKIAILHHAKAAGSSLAAMFDDAAKRGGWQMLDTFAPPLRWGRDWTRAELDAIASGQMLGMHGHRHIVHNHACGWPADTVEQWAKQGWVFVSTYRPIRDRLCSFYHWNRCARILTGPVEACETLDEFLRVFLADPRYRVDFAPHACDHLVTHWATPETLAEVVGHVAGIAVPARRENASESIGWDAACDAGEIAPATRKLVDKHPAVKAWEKFAKKRMWTP